MAKKRVEFMDTSFRDGFQSVFGARVATKDFMAPLEAAVEAGTTYFEAGGGARFQSLFFYCIGCAAFFLPALFLTWFYPLTKEKHAELRAELENQNLDADLKT